MDLWYFILGRATSNSNSQPRKAGEIQTLIGVKHRQTFRENYLNAFIGKDWRGRTIPDKPQSRLQRYQATEGEKKWLMGATNRTHFINLRSANGHQIGHQQS
jgi:hypothetical protein